jgi:hypothetical protein
VKKHITAMLLGVAMVTVAAAPARAVEPIGALVLGLITVGTHVLMDQYHKGNLKAPADECKAEIVKSPNGNYYYERFVDPNGDCTYVSKLNG